MSSLIRGTSATGKRVVAKKSGGVGVNFRRDTYNPAFGGGGGKAPYTLPWAPPVLENPTTIKITNAVQGVTMDPTKDYIILLPGARGNDLQTTPHQNLNRSGSGLSINGGRNVTMIGGAVRRDIDQAYGQYVRNSSGFRAVRNRAFYIGDWTGTMFIEGVYIGGQHLYETFNVSTTAANAKLYVQNCRVDTLCLKTPDTYGNSNHDGGDAGMQNWDGPGGGMYISHYSIKGTTYQAFFMQPNQFGTKPPAENIIQHIDINWNDPTLFNPERRLPWPYMNSKFGTGVQMFVFNRYLTGQGPTYVNDTYLNPPDSGTYNNPLVVVSPDTADASYTLNGVTVNPKPTYNATSKIVSWPGLSWVTGEGVRIGRRPGGDLVKNEYVGIGYISPGYDNDNSQTAPAAPTTAPSLTVTPGTNVNNISWTSVTGATTYKLYRSTSSPVTTSSTLIGNNVTSQQYTDTGLTGGTAYYYGVAGSSTSGDGPISATVSGTPVAPVSTAGTFFSDDFNRADGAIGPNWVDDAGVYSVTSNVAGVVDKSNLSSTAVEGKTLTAATAAPGTGAFSFGITVTAVSSNTTKLHPRVYTSMLTENDTTNCYYATVIDSTTVANRKVSLYKRTNASGTQTETEVANFAQNYAAPYTIEIKQTDNLVEVRYNGTLVVSYTDPAPLTGRYCGAGTRQGGPSGGINNTVLQRFDNAIGKTY